MVKTIIVQVNDDEKETLIEKKGSRTWAQVLYDGLGMEMAKETYTVIRRTNSLRPIGALAKIKTENPLHAPCEAMNATTHTYANTDISSPSTDEDA
jgi:hypothetical protein